MPFGSGGVHYLDDDNLILCVLLVFRLHVHELWKRMTLFLDKVSPSAFEKHSGREGTRKWKYNVWVMVKGEKVPLSRTVLLKYYNQAQKNGNGSQRGHYGRPSHRDEFVHCSKCNKDRRFRLRTKEECRIYHDAVLDHKWKCSDLASDRESFVNLLVIAIKLNLIWLKGRKIDLGSCFIESELLAMKKKKGQVAKHTEDALALHPARDAPHVSVLGAVSAGFRIAAARPAWTSLQILKFNHLLSKSWLVQQQRSGGQTLKCGMSPNFVRASSSWRHQNCPSVSFPWKFGTGMRSLWRVQQLLLPRFSGTHCCFEPPLKT
ncbi:ultrapetala, partial [Asimina triloba]